MAAIGGFSYMIWDIGWEGFGGWPVILGLVSIPGLILMMWLVFRDPRAIWIENGALHFYSGIFDDLFFFFFSEETVPLDSIDGLSSVKSELPGAVKRHGIYVDMKSGKSHKLLTFLLSEPRPVVMARLRAALGFAEAKV